MNGEGWQRVSKTGHGFLRRGLKKLVRRQAVERAQECEGFAGKTRRKLLRGVGQREGEAEES